MNFLVNLASFEFAINTGFLILTLGIMFSFLSRFKGKIPWKQTNVSGFVLISLGLSFHILGRLTVEVLIGKPIYLKINHFLDAFIALAVVLFILGSAFIAYHNSAENNKVAFKIFAWVYAIIGMLNVFYHFYVYLQGDTNFTILGQDPVKADLSFLAFEMVSLTFIYIIIFFNAKNDIRPLVVARYRILSFISLGFVLVILVDSLIRLGTLTVGSELIFFVLFFLHVITVGGMYSLVFMPSGIKKIFGITVTPS